MSPHEFDYSKHRCTPVLTGLVHLMELTIITSIAVSDERSAPPWGFGDVWTTEPFLMAFSAR